MRKHFLILMLLALLPFVAWGAVVKVTPYNLDKAYGQADPSGDGLIYDVDATGAAGWATGAGNKDLEILRAGLQISRNGANAGENPGDYTYTLSFKKSLALAAASVAQPPFTVAQVNTFVDTYSIGVVGTAVLSISKAAMDVDVTVANIDPQIYTGSAITPTLTVKNKYTNEALVKDTDYSVEWEHNTEVGTATVTLTGIGSKYQGSVQKQFLINAGISGATITLQGVDNLEYNGQAQVPTNFIVKVGNQTLTKDTHYTVSYSNSNIEGDDQTYATTYAGTVTVTITGKANEGFSGTASTTYQIAPKAVAAAKIDVALGTNPAYTGSPVNPNITTVQDITDSTNPLAITTDDYTITNASTNATAANGATATLTLKRNFSGTTTVNYTIDKKQLALTTNVTFDQTGASATPDQYYWSNTDIKPAVIILDGTTTVPASNFEVAYKNWNGTAESDYTKAIGQKRVTITAKANGNYTFTGTNTKVYEIVQRPLTITVNDVNVGYGVAIQPTLKIEGIVAEPGVTPANTTESQIRAAAVYAYKNSNNQDVQGDINAAAPGVYTIYLTNDSKTAIAAINANYAMTFENGTLNKTAGQIVVKIDDRTIEYGDAKPTTGWKVTHVSGLSAQDAANIGNIVNIANIQGGFKLVESEDAVLDVDATGYDVKYNDGTHGDNVIYNTNYLITVQTGKLKVSKKNITSAMVVDIPAQKYTGEAYTPAVNIKHTIKKANGTPYNPATGAATAYDIPTNYYLTAYDENYNAGNHEAHLSVGENNHYYTTKTDVNYTLAEANAYNQAHNITNPNDPDYKTTNSVKETLDYVIKSYTIAPLQITITADNFTGNKAWTYGKSEPVYTATIKNTINNSGDINVEPAKIAALKNGEQPEGFNGTLVIKRVGADGVGTWTGALKPVIVNAQGVELDASAAGAGKAALNYVITPANGNLEVKKGTVVVKVKDAEVPYGEQATKFYLEAITGMENDPGEFDNIVTYSNDPADYGYVYNECKARGTYTLTYKSTALTPTATNYDIVFDTDGTGTLTVTKRPIKLKAKDTAINYTAAATWQPSLSTAYIEQVVGDGFLGFDGGITDNKIKSVIASIAVASKNIGENDINLTKKADTGNYEVTIVSGTLTINADATVTTITLNRVLKDDYEDQHSNTAAYLINANKDQFRNVTFSDFNMIAEKWYPLVLPFATSVKDISKAFGYAVVDVFDGTTAEGKIKFKLHMGDIEANTPFIVKVFENQNMNDVTNYYVATTDNTNGNKAKFANVKIVKAYDDNCEVKINKGSDVDFVGTYKGRTEGFRSNMYYFAEDAKYGQYYKGNDTNKTYLRPLGAYFVDNAANAANTAREILIEEPNGSTTAISAITVDGAFVEADGWYTTNGVKLQGVPTEKGVYIRNGKKIVIK